jgi:antitoxin (DNA-binding transcriptional repressor) of toxin-antitoxin stability system
MRSCNRSVDSRTQIGTAKPRDCNLDTKLISDTLMYHVMAARTTIRDLRNHFPKVKKLVESEGEVLLTDRGKPKYRLTLYTDPSPLTAAPIDYWARLNSYQSRSMTKTEARELNEENRGDR